MRLIPAVVLVLCIVQGLRFGTCNLLEDLVDICKDDAMEMAVFIVSEEVLEGELGGFEDCVFDGGVFVLDEDVIPSKQVSQARRRK